MKYLSCLFAACLALAVAHISLGNDLGLELDLALDNPVRPEEDKTRDAARKPAQVLEFLGLKEGMTVADVMAGGGYYTEVLAAGVGTQGKVIAHNYFWGIQIFEARNAASMKERAARYSNVEVLVADFGEVNLPEDFITRAKFAELPVDIGPHTLDPSAYDGRADLAFTGLNLHDVQIFTGDEGVANFLAGIYAMLKPGGILGLTDHRGEPQYDNAKLHRITDQEVRDYLTAAGFIIEAESDILANPKDDHSLSFRDPSLERNTDRILMRARKPVE